MNILSEKSFPHPLAMPPKPTGTVALFGEILVDVFPDRTVLGGAPFNVARHLRAFGLHPVLITRTGNDALREELLAAMTSFGMDTQGVQCDPAHPTGQVIVHMEPKGHRFEILPEQAYDFIHAGVTRMISLAVQPELLYFGTLAQRHPVSRRALSTLLRSGTAKRLLDLNLREPWYDKQTITRSLTNADVVKLNDSELGVIAGLLRLSGASPQQQAATLIRQFSLDRILVTCGPAGAWQLDDEGIEVRLDSTSSASLVVDTVGAGDAFSAVFILGSFAGWPVEITLSRAHAFAAALCGIRGAIPRGDDFYAPFLAEWQIDEEVPR
jgi:fructokinase